MLTACAMGLGTCVISASLPALNVPGMKAQFCIPDEFSAIAPIIVTIPTARLRRLRGKRLLS